MPSLKHIVPPPPFVPHYRYLGKTLSSLTAEAAKAVEDKDNPSMDRTYSKLLKEVEGLSGNIVGSKRLQGPLVQLHMARARANKFK